MSVFLCVDSRSWSEDIPGHRGRPPLRGVLQTTPADSAAGGDDTKAGLGSNVSDAPVIERKHDAVNREDYRPLTVKSVHLSHAICQTTLIRCRKHL